MTEASIRKLDLFQAFRVRNEQKPLRDLAESLFDGSVGGKNEITRQAYVESYIATAANLEQYDLINATFEGKKAIKRRDQRVADLAIVRDHAQKSLDTILNSASTRRTALEQFATIGHDTATSVYELKTILSRR